MEEKIDRRTLRTVVPIDGKLRCTKCKEWKATDNYSPNKVRRCGFASLCKQCAAEDYRRRYPMMRDEVTQRVTRWKEANPDKRRAYDNKAAATAARKFPEKLKARHVTAKAILAGTLIPQPCRVCGEAKTDAHHWSYEEAHWLDVQWLCREHHAEEHVRLRREAAQVVNENNQTQ